MRSLLFVPGDRPDRFGKAITSRADAVCIDLEDAVAPDRKAQARSETFGALLRTMMARCPIGVRINHPASEDGKADLEAFAAFNQKRRAGLQMEAGDFDGGVPVSFLMIPKVAGPHDFATLPEGKRIAVIESASGLRRAWDIAETPGVSLLLFGGADYSADIGASMDWEALLFARSALVAAAGAAGIQILDVPHLDVADEAGLRASTERAKALGFTGRACIHPNQVAVVNSVFTPSEQEVERARALIRALEAAKGAAALLDGKLIEKPVIRAAERILARAGKT